MSGIMPENLLLARLKYLPVSYQGESRGYHTVTTFRTAFFKRKRQQGRICAHCDRTRACAVRVTVRQFLQLGEGGGQNAVVQLVAIQLQPLQLAELEQALGQLPLEAAILQVQLPAGGGEARAP